MIYFNHIKGTDFELNFVMFDPQDGDALVDLSQSVLSTKLFREDGTQIQTNIQFDTSNAFNGQFKVITAPDDQDNWIIGDLMMRISFQDVPKPGSTPSAPTFENIASEMVKITVEPPL